MEYAASIYNTISGGLNTAISNRVTALTTPHEQIQPYQPAFLSGGVPMWQWAAAGGALLLVGIMVMRRRG